MKKLTLSNWAHIAEIIAAIVIVISILYVGKELNQNTQAMHDDSWQAILDKLIELDMAEAATPELSQVIFRGETKPDTMTEEEWFRFSRFVLARLGILEYGYLSRRANSLGDFHWETIEGFLQNKMCIPGYRLYWSEIEEGVYHPDYVRYVDGLIANCTKGK